MTYGWDPIRKIRGPYGFEPNPRLSELRVGIQFGDIEGQTCYTAPPKEGAVWVVTDLQGWWEPAEVATKTIDAPSGDGVLAFDDRMGPRGIILSSFIQAAEHGNNSFRVDQLIECLSRQRRAVLRVVEGIAGVSREADVRLLDVRTNRKSGLHAELTISLQADDPLRYGAGSQVLRNGRNVLLNPGDAQCWPVIDLVGPHSALSIAHPGGTFSFPALSSGQRRTVDGRNGDVWSGNSRVFVGNRVWPRVDVGGAEWTVAGMGSGTATVRRFEAWT